MHAYLVVLVCDIFGNGVIVHVPPEWAGHLAGAGFVIVPVWVRPCSAERTDPYLLS